MVKVAVVAVLIGLSVVAGSAAAGPLDAPQNLQAARQGDQLVLTWDAVDGALGYVVYRDGAFLGEAEEPTYTDQSSTASASAISVYWVTALLPGGETVPSNPATAPYCWGFTSGVPPIYVNPETCLEDLLP